MAARPTGINSQNVEADNCALVDALTTLHSKYHSLKKHTNKQFALLQSGGEELRETKQCLASLQTELASTKEELERVQGGKFKKGKPKNGKCSRDRELDYDGRKDKWAKSEYRLADYRDALTGMEQEVIDHKAAAAELERNNAELALRIVDLERRCAELDGRRAEREDANSELRAALDNSNEELERLSKNVNRMQKEFTKLNVGMRTGQTQIDSSSREITIPDEETAPRAKSLEKHRTLSVSPVTQLIPAKRKKDEPQWRAEDYDDVAGQSGIDHPKEQPLTNQVHQLRNDNFNDVFAGASFTEQYLIVPIGHGDPGTQYPLINEELTIGRSRDNDIPISDYCVSRVHARVILDGQQVCIEDMGSKNGLLVNAERNERKKLEHGDRFTIGTKEFELIDVSMRN